MTTTYLMSEADSIDTKENVIKSLLEKELINQKERLRDVIAIMIEDINDYIEDTIFSIDDVLENILIDKEVSEEDVDMESLRNMQHALCNDLKIDA